MNSRSRPSRTVRQASAEDAVVVATLLHAFNTEFETPSPGVNVLASRLARLLSTPPTTTALLVGDPAVGVAVATRRPNVWYAGDVLLLDELYVRPSQRGQGFGGLLMDRLLADAATTGVSAVEINVDEADVDTQRFYRRQGFLDTDPDTGDRAFYFSRQLTGAQPTAPVAPGAPGDPVDDRRTDPQPRDG
ncbi:MAG TPA: GNAT family N-acetyltransferase [Microlunatus sp.]